MLCIKCGALLPDDANYCLKCGEPQKPSLRRDISDRSTYFDVEFYGYDDVFTYTSLDKEILDEMYNNLLQSDSRFKVIKPVREVSGKYVIERSVLFRNTDINTIFCSAAEKYLFQRGYYKTIVPSQGAKCIVYKKQ